MNFDPLVFLLLIAGDALAEFVFRVQRRGDGALGRPRPTQVLVTAAWPVAMLTFFLPFAWQGIAVLLAGALGGGVASLLLDRAVVRGLCARVPALGVLARAALMLAWWAGVTVVLAGWRLDNAAWVQELAVIVGAWTLALAVNVRGASFVVERVLARCGSPSGDGEGGGDGRGRVIGVLERLLMLALFGAGQPAAIGLVLAAKSIARFEDLKVRTFSEVYLIGTLTSTLCAAVAGVALMLLGLTG